MTPWLYCPHCGARLRAAGLGEGSDARQSAGACLTGGLVEDGRKAGDRWIVEGRQRGQPGGMAKAVEAGSAPVAATPDPSQPAPAAADSE